MNKIIVNITNTSLSYPIFIGKNLLKELNSLVDLNTYSKIFILTDKNVVNYIPEIGNIDSLVLEPGEREKNIKSLERIWNFLLKNNADRKSLIINLGGGVICDMGGFAASTYMRGIDFIQIPTTLLSQADASIGGKVAIDFANVKNLIGAFNQPMAVIIDISTLSTLPKREFSSGFAEIIKHGIIADKKYFELVTVKNPLQFTQEELIKIISQSIEIKKQIVEEDEKETGKRKILNFGHTIGHAIESLSQETKNPLLHGEAISIGMAKESYLANLAGILSDSEYKTILTALEKSELPTDYPKDIKLSEIHEKIIKDKKNQKGKILWTLIKGIGSPVINQEIDKKIIIESLV